MVLRHPDGEWFMVRVTYYQTTIMVSHRLNRQYLATKGKEDLVRVSKSIYLGL
jgi:hypothetical protein